MTATDPFAEPSFPKIVLAFGIGALFGITVVFPTLRHSFSLASLGELGSMGTVVLLGLVAMVAVTTGLFGLYQLFWLIDR